MADPDGSVLIHVDLDDKESVSRLKQLERRIETLNNKIYYKKQDRLPIEKQVSELGVALDQAKERLEELRSASAGDEAIKEQEATVKALQSQFDQADNALKRIDKSIDDGTRELSRMSDEAGRLAGIVAGVQANTAGLAGETEQAAAASGANADATAQAAAAAGGAADNLERAGAAAAEATVETKGLSKAMSEADKRADKFTKRIVGLAKRVFVFSLITSGLRAVRDWFGKVYQTNDQATAAVGRLKGALMAMVQPLVNVFIPVFTRLVNLLTTLASYGATITATLFGTTAEKSAQAAKGLNAETKALDKTGKAAKKAEKSLASFDEINQIGSNSEDAAAGGAGDSAADAPDFDSVVGQKLDALTAIVSGALLALGAILVFSGANVPLGLGLMAIGALGLAATIMANWDTIQDALQGPIGVITAIISAALLAIGAILLFSGGNIPLGLGLIAAGAAGLAATINANWETIQQAMQGPLGKLLVLVSGALLVLGAVLVFSGANIAMGLALIVAGAVGLATYASVVNWDTVSQLLQGPIGVVTAIVSGALLVLGAVLTFSGFAVPLGIALLAAGAIGLAATMAVNWNTIVSQLGGTVSAVTVIVSTALLALGVIMLFTGVAIPLGLGMMVVGAAGLAATMAANWDSMPAQLSQTVTAVTVIISAALLVLGAILFFTGVAAPLGLGMIVAGSAGLASAAVLNWDFFKDKIAEVCNGIKDWWNNNMAQYLTWEYWANLGKNILDGFVNGIKSKIDSVLNIVSNVTSKVTGAFGGASKSIRNAASGGGSIGTRASARAMPSINPARIPHLATGAVIPPNRQFLAVLGDQTQGNNIEAPESAIEAAVARGIANSGLGNHTAILQIGEQEFGRLIYSLNNQQVQRVGIKLGGAT